MTKRWYLETSTTTGQPQFVSVKRTRSHGHRHHHHHHDHGTIRVSREEWNAIVERERVLAETNKVLVAESIAIKGQLSAAHAEAHNLCHVVVPQLQAQIATLVADNESLRRTLDNAGNNSSKHCREEDRLRHKAERMEKENKALKEDNSDLRTRVACLSRQLEQSSSRRLADLVRDVDYWKEQTRFWKGKFEDTKRRHDDACGTLEIRTEKMRAYEEILKRRRII